MEPADKPDTPPSLSLSPTLDMDADLLRVQEVGSMDTGAHRGMAMGGHSGKMATTPQKEVSAETNPAHTLMSDFWLQNSEKINIRCLSCPVYVPFVAA